MRAALLTGATGFVGSSVASELRKHSIPTSKAVRQERGKANEIAVGSINGDTDWRPALEGCDIVIHLAARTPGRNVGDDEFLRVNDQGTAKLTAQACELGVERFVLVSSIFTIAENASEEPISDSSTARSALPYGRSKLAAEAHVAEFAAGPRLGISLRPPMVYGAQAKGNWNLLQKIAAKGIPLPFGSINNRRTMISIDNLAHAIVHAATTSRPGPSGAYAVADSESVSLQDIVRHLREGMKKPARLFALPSGLMVGPLELLGLKTMTSSLFGDLEVDASRFRTAFDWTPEETAAEGIRKSGAGFIRL